MSLAEQMRAQIAQEQHVAYLKGLFFGGAWGFIGGVLLSCMLIITVTIWGQA